MAYVSKIKDSSNSINYIKYGVYPVIGTQTESTSAWTGVLNVPSLYDGLTIAYFLPYKAVSGTNVTLNLTLADGTTTTGAVNVYYTSTSRMAAHYGAGSTILLTYWSAGSVSVSGTATAQARWLRCDYNSNTTYAVATTAANGLMSSTDKSNLDASYAHSVTNRGTSAAAGLYKIQTNSEGHVTGTTAVAKADITALGIPESDNNTTYSISNSANIISLNGSNGNSSTISLTASDVGALSSTTTIPSITLNGSTTSSPSFYAPINAGTSGYVLKSNGSGVPTWQTNKTIVNFDISNPNSPTADMTFSQILTAISNGEDVEGHVQMGIADVILPLAYSSQYQIGFAYATIDTVSNIEVEVIYKIIIDYNDSISFSSVTGNNTTYSLSMSSNIITLTGSDGNASTIALPIYNGNYSTVGGGA